MIAPPLLPDVAQAVLGAALLALVEHDEVGVVEHVDLLELARGTVFARHDVQRQVHQIHDLGVRLTDTGGFDDHQVEPGSLVQLDHVLQHGGGRQMRPPRRERAHEDVVRRQAVHADAIAEQRAAAAAPRRVHRHHGDLRLRELPRQARQQLVREARLAPSAGAGDADHRRLVARAGHGPPDLLRIGTGCAFQHRNGPCDENVVAGIERPQLVRGLAHRCDALQDIIDHAREPHAPPILGRVDLLHAAALERLDLVRCDGAATADHHADVLAAAFAQHVHHVGEILVVAALVGAHRDRVGVLVDGGAHDVGDAAIVPEVHHLGAARLQQAPDHVDGGIVAVEQRGRGHEPQG